MGVAVACSGCHGRPPEAEVVEANGDPALAYQAARQVLLEGGYDIAQESAAARKLRVRAQTEEDDTKRASFISVQVTPDGMVRLVPSGALVKRDGSVRGDLREELGRLERRIGDRLHGATPPADSGKGGVGTEPTGRSPEVESLAYRQPPSLGQPIPLARAAQSTPVLTTSDSPEPTRPTAARYIAAAPQPTAYAVVIGIEKYSGAIDSPTGARGDAARFADMAKTSLGVSPDHVLVELDEQATKGSIERSLAWVQGSVPPGGRIYFYFSGHGAPEAGGHAAPGDDPGRREATAFLVPADGDPKFLEETAIPMKEVLAKLGQSKAKEVMVFVDACFNGLGPRAVSAPGRPLVKVKEEAPLAQTAVFSASRADEIAGPASGGAGGLFTNVVLEGLGKGEADVNGDGQVSLAELNEYVPARVAREAKRQDNRDQNPTLAVGPGLGSAANVIVEWGLPSK
jgi:hypothetical protein